jgi:hypothetical protein
MQFDRLDPIIDRLDIDEYKTKIDEHLLVLETRALESLSRHEQRLQNGMLKVLKQLKDLQKEAPVQRQSGFVSNPRVSTPPAAAPEPEVTPIITSEFTPEPPHNPQSTPNPEAPKLTA